MFECCNERQESCYFMEHHTIISQPMKCGLVAPSVSSKGALSKRDEWSKRRERHVTGTPRSQLLVWDPRGVPTTLMPGCSELLGTTQDVGMDSTESKPRDLE